MKKLSGILGVLLILFVSYIIYDKVYAEPRLIEKTKDEVTHENQTDLIQNDNDVSDSNKVDSSSNLLDKNQIVEYNNEDGSYGVQKSYYDGNYNVNLNLMGEVSVCYQNNCNKISNLVEVVDMLELSVAGVEEEQKLYFLLDNGDVYTYKYQSYKDNNYSATKVDKVSNVKKIFEFSYKGNNKGGSRGIVAVTNNNDYVEIDRESN